MAGFWDDLKAGARTLRRAPSFSALAILILALGLGGSAVLFSLADSLLLHPFRVRDAESLVAVETKRADGFESVSAPDAHELAALSGVFSGLVVHIRWPFTIRTGNGAERVSGDFVSSNYFDVLGVALPLGRDFAAAEPPVAVISDALWRRTFSSDPAVVGKTLQVNGKAVTIVGIAPRDFLGLRLGESPHFWISLDHMAELVPRWFGLGSQDLLNRRDVRFFDVVARLRPGVTLAEAGAAAETQARRLQKEYPETNADATFVLISAREAWLPRAARSPLVTLLSILGIAMAFVLAITCSNVANLLLVRALNRFREIAIRGALGASRARIARELLFESLSLYAVGLALGLGLAALALGLLRFSPLVSSEITVALEPALDGRVFAFTSALTLVTGIVFGLLPAVRASRASLRTELAPGKPRLARGLVFAQAALAVTLLIGAALFARTVSNLFDVDPGFRSENVLLASLDFNTLEYRFDRARGMAVYEEALERIRALPEVVSATWAGDAPLETRRIIIGFHAHERKPEKESDWVVVDCNVVGPDYFKTLGIPLLSGRDFSREDRKDTRDVAVVNESMARQYWPGSDAVGRRVWVRGSTGIKEVEIIGVARDVRQRSLRAGARPYLHLALFQRYFPEMTFHVRTAGSPQPTGRWGWGPNDQFRGSPERVLPAVRAAFAAIDEEIPLFKVGTLRGRLEASFARERLAAQVLGASTFFALLLAALGVYGVTAHSATQRSREVGIRMALGAKASDIRFLFLREGIAPVVLGVAVGLGAAWTLSGFAESLLFGVERTDFVTFALSALALVAIAGTACYFPARRAGRVAPAVSLRHE